MLKSKRLQHNKTMQDIADELNTGLTIISYYESYKRFPRANDLMAFAKAYHLSDEELLEYLKKIS